MASNLTFLVLMMICVRGLGQHMCSSTPQYSQLEEGSALTNSGFETVTRVGLLQCVVECYNRHRCKSFNYQTSTRTCELNFKNKKATPHLLLHVADSVYSDILNWPGKLAGACNNHTCTSNSTCRAVDGLPVCDVIYCDLPTSPSHGQVSLPSNHDDIFSKGERVKHTCETGYRGNGELLCGDGGVWEGNTTCDPPPASCNKMKKCDPTAPDGEYWLLPELTNGTAVKVFCKKTLSYITLNEEYNFSTFPETFQCTKTYCGTTKYSKVTLFIATMKIGSNKLEYSSSTCTNGNSPIGRAAGCESSNCGSIGPSYFKINTTGTGLIIDPATRWTVTSGHVNVTWSDNGRVIEGTCSSNCEQCHADTVDSWFPLTFVVDADYQPPETAATVVDCS